mmetsp:Transcript_31961/g.80405  ORF Transcript_31961/g.80405 Transcript_31961/m.80405 type:complete len:252 (+) Transcript_31961:109-864(+)
MKSRSSTLYSSSAFSSIVSSTFLSAVPPSAAAAAGAGAVAPAPPAAVPPSFSVSAFTLIFFPRSTARAATSPTRSTSRLRNLSIRSFSRCTGRRKLRGRSMMCSTPDASPTASSCCRLSICGQNLMAPIPPELTRTIRLASCERSRKSQTSTVPSCLAVKSTPGRVGEKHPAERYASADGLLNSGVFSPCLNNLKVQSPTLIMMSGKNGERSIERTGPACALDTSLACSGCGSLSGLEKSQSATSPSMELQ